MYYNNVVCTNVQCTNFVHLNIPRNFPLNSALDATVRPGYGRRKHPTVSKQLAMCFLTSCSSSCCDSDICGDVIFITAWV